MTYAVDWGLLPNFSRPEFVCRCGCHKCDMEWSFLMMLQCARTFAGVPFFMTCGDRCVVHNQAVGGVPDSSHVSIPGLVKCTAGDIAALDSYIRSRVLRGLRKAGFTRIGIRKGFIHADNDATKPQDRTWLY